MGAWRDMRLQLRKGRRGVHDLYINELSAQP